MLLPELIAEKIKREGPVSFRDFMEMSLYYPELGYYTSMNDKIGKNGDFYTSSDLTSLFGAIIGKQIEEMWEAAGMNHLQLSSMEQEQGSSVMTFLTILKITRNYMMSLTTV